MKEWAITIRVLNAPDDFSGHTWATRILQQLDAEHIMASGFSQEIGPTDPAVYPDPMAEAMATTTMQHYAGCYISQVLRSDDGTVFQLVWYVDSSCTLEHPLHPEPEPA